MADDLVFLFRVSPADLIPEELLKLSTEDQIERFALLMSDIQDFADIQAQAAVAGMLTLLAPDTAVVYTNAPAGGAAEWAASSRWRTIVDLSRFTECRLSAYVEVTGAATATLAIEATAASSFDFLDGADGPNISLNGTGVKVSDWVPIFSGYRTDVTLRPSHVGGNGAADPAIGLVTVQFR